METFEFQVQGSAPEPYIARFTIDQGKAWATCTCPAGQARQICKHRLSILEGDLTACLNGAPSEVSRLLGLLPGTPLAVALARLAEAEAALAAAKIAQTQARRALARIMSE